MRAQKKHKVTHRKTQGVSPWCYTLHKNDNNSGTNGNTEKLSTRTKRTKNSLSRYVISNNYGVF